MFRLIGFVLGSAISVGAILLILGIPQFHLSNPNLDKGRFDQAVEKLKKKTRDVETIVRDVAETVEETADELPPAEDTPGDTASIVAEAPGGDAGDTNTGDNAAPAELPEYRLPADTGPAMVETQWYPFWNPFRSKIAATGFVSRLEKVTGLDYRVVKVKTGVYQVAFAYGSDEERRMRLSQISAATGLDLPES